MNTEQLEALYGPIFPHSDHKTGETITFRDTLTSEIHTADIEWVQAPGPIVEGGNTQPVRYIMDIIDPTTGFPYEVFPSDVIES